MSYVKRNSYLFLYLVDRINYVNDVENMLMMLFPVAVQH